MTLSCMLTTPLIFIHVNENENKNRRPLRFVIEM